MDPTEAAPPTPLRTVSDLEQDLRRQLERIIDRGGDELAYIDAIGVESLTNALLALDKLRPVYDGPPPPEGNPELELAVANFLDRLEDLTPGTRQMIGDAFDGHGLLEPFDAVARAVGRGE